MDSNEQKRKKLLLLGAALIVILTAIVIYFVFFRDAQVERPDPTFGEPGDIREAVRTERELDRERRTGIFSPEARLRLLSEDPVSGATSIMIEEREIVRFNEWETGHVFDIDLENLEKERISNTTIPRIHKSLWTADGEGVILRYLDEDNRTIKTYSARLEESAEEPREGETPFRLDGEFLPDNITELVISPDRNRIFWLTETPRGATGTISNPNGTRATTLITTPFTEWLPQWAMNGALSLTTKASGHAQGFLYNVPIARPSLERIVGNIRGLTANTSPDGERVLYSEGRENSLSTFLFNTQTRETVRLTVRTIPEKCVWTEEFAYCGIPLEIPRGMYPDFWYQGRVLFTDEIFSINLEDGRATRVYAPEFSDREIIDIYRPFLSTSGNYLIFNDKNDMSLWAFSIRE
jgi:hypothetical protein